MNLERTHWGVLIGDKYLSADEALDLLQWLSEQEEALVLISQMGLPTSPEPTSLEYQEQEWSLTDEEEMRSADEQIVGFEH
jgi:hypothetical protein